MLKSPKTIEEGVEIQTFGEKISKELSVFYNPKMKLNRDISILVIQSYFNKKISYCDPLCASGIRELRFLKTIPNSFEKIICGDISKTSVRNFKENLKSNKLENKKLELHELNAMNTILMQYYDMVEIDPFGSPTPFLDIAIQRVKHNGILSLTATDTAALCGVYPKTALRRYNIKAEKLLWFEEFGLRNLITAAKINAAKHDKILEPLLTYSKDHYFRVFFKVQDSKIGATNTIKELKYFKINRDTQDIEIREYEEKDTLGKIYVEKLNNKEFISKCIENLNLIKDKKNTEKLLNSLKEELEVVGSYNPHKLMKHNKFSSDISFDEIREILQNKGFKTSKCHNNRLAFKTNAKGLDIINIMKKKN